MLIKEKNNNNNLSSKHICNGNLARELKGKSKHQTNPRFIHSRYYCETKQRTDSEMLNTLYPLSNKQAQEKTEMWQLSQRNNLGHF